MSHLEEYESNDVDSSGTHRARFTVKPGKGFNEYYVYKIHNHEDYDWLSQESGKPGSREEERHHFVRLFNGSFLQSSDRHISGHLPHTRDRKRPDIFFGDAEDRMKTRAFSKMTFRQICDDERRRRRSVSETDVTSLVRDSLAVSAKLPKGKSIPLAEFGKEEKPFDLDHLVDCIADESVSTLEQSQCVLKLKSVVRQNDSNSRLVVDFVCRHENPRSYRWRFLVQVLIESHYGQDCLIEMMSNASLKTSHRLRVISTTFDVIDPHPRLVDFLLKLSWEQDDVGVRERHAAVLSLGRIARISRKRKQHQMMNTIVEHLESRLRSCPAVYESDAHVATYARAIGSAAHNGSLATLVDLSQHPSGSVRSAALFGLRHFNWSDVEPIYVESVRNSSCTVEEHRSAVKAMSERAEELSSEAVESLVALYHRSINQGLHSESILRKFFSAREDPVSLDAFERGERLRSVRDIKERLVKRSLDYIDPLQPLVDKDFGIDKTYSVDFGVSEMKASLRAEFRNLVRIYLSIFDGQFDVDCHNEAEARLHMFFLDVELVDAQVIFTAGVAFKNDILSNLLNVVLDTAVKLVGEVRNAIAPLVEVVLYVLDFLEETFTDISRLIAPISPIIDGINQGVEMLDMAINASYVAESFIDTVEGYVLKLRDLDLADQIIGRLEEIVNSFVTQKLQNLTALCDSVVAYITDPIDRMDNYVSNVTGVVNSITEVVDSFPDDPATVFGSTVCQAADQLLNFNVSVSLDGFAILSSLTGFSEKLSGVIESAGLSTIYEILVMSKNLTTFHDAGMRIVDGFRNGFSAGEALAKQLVNQFQVIVTSMQSALNISRGVVQDLQSQLSGYSVVTQITNVIQQLGLKSMLSSGLVDAGLEYITNAIKSVENEVCGVVNTTLATVESYVDVARNVCYDAMTDLSARIVGFLRNASQEIFGALPFNTSLLNTVDVFEMSQDLLERGVGLVTSFVEDEVLTRFDDFASSFVETVNETLAANLDDFVVWFEGYVTLSEKYLNGSKEFIEFVNLAKNVTDLVAVTLSGVPGIETLKNVMDTVLDTTLNVAGWIYSVLEFLTNSDKFVSAAEKVRDKVLNLILFGFDKFRSILVELLNKLSEALLQAGTVAMNYLSDGFQLVQDIISNVMSLVDKIENFIISTLGNIQNLSEKLKSILHSSCSFSGLVDVVMNYGTKITGIQSSWNALVNATTNSVSQKLIDTTAAALGPISSLATKLSNFLNALYELTDVYTGDWATYVDMDCVEGTLCLKQMFTDSLEKLLISAESILEDIGFLDQFLSIMGEVNKYVEVLQDIIVKVTTRLQSLIDFASSNATVNVIDLATTALNVLVPKEDRNEIGGASCTSLVSGFPLVKDLNALVKLGKDAWHDVSDTILGAVDTVLNVARDFSENLKKLCSFFTVLDASKYILDPAKKIIRSAESVARELESLVEDAIFPVLRFATNVVLSFRTIVSDIKEFVNNKIVRQIEGAILWLETKPLELLSSVRDWVDTILLIDTGLEPGTLEDPSELPYCSNTTCVQVLPRSTDAYRNIVFKVKYTHLTVLERDRTLIPGLFENYQVQGITPIDQDGTHYLLSMFGTEDKVEDPNLLVVQEKGSGDIVRIYRVFDDSGNAVRGPFGVLVIADWVYIHGLHSIQDVGTVGILYGILKESLLPLTEETPPVDIQMTLAEYTDSFGTGMFYAANESYLWIADFFDSEGNVLTGEPLPEHHEFDDGDQKGWIAGYLTDFSGFIEAESKYQPGDLPVDVVKPSQILTIGENVAGVVSFVQNEIESLSVLRCVAKPGFSCKLDFIEMPQTQDITFEGIPVMYGVALELDRSVRVPSGAVDVCFIEKGESLVITHNSGAQAEQEKREVTGGDLEDSTISLAVPVLQNQFDTDAVTNNQLSLIVLNDEIIDQPVIDFDDDDDDDDDDDSYRRKKREEDEQDTSDCFTGTGELYSKDKIFYKTCEFPDLDSECDSEWIVVAEYIGIILSLEFIVSGRLTVNYEAALCPLAKTVSASLLPEGSLTLTGEVTVTVGIASASLKLDITIMDTTFVPTVDLSIRGAVLTACADFKVEIRPITITLSVGFGIMGPIMHCPSWKVWECTFEWGVIYTVWQDLFSWSYPQQELTLIPEICFSTPDSTPPETEKAIVTAKQNDARSLTVDMVGFQDPESEWLHYTVTAKSTSGIAALVKDRDVYDAETAIIDGLLFGHGSYVTVTVTCHNSVGLTSSMSAEPFLADLTPPEVVKLRDGTKFKDTDFDHSYNVIRASYDDIVEDESSLVIAEWAIGTTKGGEDIQPFTDTLQSKDLANSHLTLKHKTTYYVSFRTMNSVNMEAVVTTDGVLIDHTIPLIGDIPVMDGSYDCVEDYDYQLAQHSFKACWLGIFDDESGMDYFDWTVADSSGRSQFELERVYHYFGYREDLRLVPKETYTAYVVAWNQAGLNDKFTSDGMIVDPTNPICSEILDLLPGYEDDVDYAANLTHFGATWTCQDPESGIDSVRAAVGSYKGGTDVLRFEDAGFGPNGTTTVIFPYFQAEHANRYYVTGKAVNKAALITTFWSDGVLVDSTAPSYGDIYLRDGDGGGAVHSPDIDFQISDREICARWLNAFVELESPIENYYVSIFTFNGTLLLKEHNVLQKTSICFSDLVLNSGEIYRVAVRAKNEAGLSALIETDGVLVDSSVPLEGRLYDGQNFGVDIDAWTESTSAFGNFKVCQSYETVDIWPPDNPYRPIKRPCASFEFRDRESGISHVETNVIDENGVEMALWQFAAPSFYSMGRVIDGRQGGFYRFVLRAYNFAGRRVETTSNGTVIDTTSPVLEDLIEYDYDSSVREDIDYLEKPDINLGISWFSDEDVTEIVFRDWAIGSYSGGTDLLEFTSPLDTNSAHYPLASLSLGHSYFVTVRITNAAGLRTAVTSDGFLVDYRPPSEGYVQDGWDVYDIDYQTTNTTMWCLWRWIDDYESGISELQVGISENDATPMSYETVSQLASTAVLDDLTLVSGHQYICNVKAIDYVGLFSVSVSNGLVVDMSGPICSGSVYDGETGEADITSMGSVFVARWDPCNEEETLIEEYLLGIAIDPAGQKFAYPFRSFGSLLTGRYQNVELKQASTYYAVVRVVNSAGLTTSFMSDGVQIDTTPPTCFHVGDGLTNDVDFETTPRFAAVNWNCEEDVTKIVNMSWLMGVYQYDDSVVDVPVDADSVEASTNNVSLPDGIKFFSTVVLFNEVGLRSVYVTNGFLVDTSPPVVEYVYDGLELGRDAEFQAELQGISANWLISDIQSGISQYVVSVSPPPEEGSDKTVVFERSEVTMPVVLTQGGFYVITVTGYNNVGLSAKGSTSGITVDSTVPMCTFVYDGPKVGSDVMFQSVDEPYSANWICEDDVSGISQIRWTVVNERKKETWNMIVPTDITVAHAYEYNVTQGDHLFTQLLLQNGAGLVAKLFSNGVIVDSTPPQIVYYLVLYKPSESVFYLRWLAEDSETRVAESLYSVGTEEGKEDIVPLTSAGHASDVSLKIADSEATVYYFTLYVVNEAQARAYETEVSVSDRTAPVFVGDLKVTVLYPERDIQETEIKDATILISWEQIYDVESNVVRLFWGLQGKGGKPLQRLPDEALSQNSAQVAGFTLRDGSDYSVVIQAENGVRLTSYKQSEYFTVNFRAISPGAVFDGAGYADENYQPHTDGVWARWEKFRSPDGIASYTWGVGLAPNDFSVQNPVDVKQATSAHVILHGLLLHGNTYFVTVIAHDARSELTVASFSDGFTVDTTPPLFHHLQFGLTRNLRYISLQGSVWVSWNCSDSESLIAKYQLSIGTAAHTEDLLPKIELDSSRRQYKVKMENIKFTQYVQAAYLTMTAFNKAGYSTTQVSHSVLFDFIKPNRGTVAAVWTKNGKHMKAQWKDFWDTGGLSHYEWSIGTAPGTENVLNATSVGPATTAISRNTVEFVQGTVYYVSVTAYDKAGNSVTGQAPPLKRDVTPPQGRFVAKDISYYTGTGSIHITWDTFIDNETKIVEYYISAGTNISGSDILPETYVGLEQYYDVDSQLFTPGEESFVTIAAVNSVGLRGQESSNKIVVDRSAPLAGKVEVGEGKFLSSLDPLIVQWKGFHDDESGIDYYEWSLCLEDTEECAVSLENVHNLTEVSKDGISSLSEGQCYVARVVAYNRAGLSNQSESDCIVFDSTPPEMKGELTFVAVEEESSQRTVVSLRWQPVLDRESFVRSLRICIGPGPLVCDEEVSVTPTTSSGISLKLRLNRNTTYYATLTAKNSVGLSSTLSSGALRTVQSSTLRGTVVDGSEDNEQAYQASTTAVSGNWFGFYGGVVEYRWGIGTTPYAADILPLKNVGLKTSASVSGISLTHGKVFYNLVEAVNKLGRTTLVSSSGFTVDNTAPMILFVRLGTRGSTYAAYEAWTGEIAFFWSVDDDESGIGSTSWSLCSNTTTYSCAATNVKVRNVTSVSTSLALSMGLCYYAEVHVQNRAGLTSLAQSNCTVFDDSPPTGGVVIDGSGARDVEYQSSTSRMSFQWSDFYDTESPIDHYVWCIGSSPFSHDVRACHEVPTTKESATVLALNLEHGRNYFATVYAINKAGLGQSACSSGVVIDSTPPLGGQVFDGARRPDVDYSNSSSTVSASWDQFQDDISSITNCSWWAGSHKYTSDIVSRTGVELATKASSTGHSIPSGWQVYISVACENIAGMTTTTYSNGYLVDTTPPTVGSARFILSGHPAPDYLSDTTDLLLSWIGFYENETSISRYHVAIVATGSEGRSTNDFFDVGLLTNISLEGAGLADGIPYKAQVLAFNLVGLYSEVATHAHIIIDRTIPETGRVFDGTGAEDDLEFQSNVTHLSARWLGFFDAQSGITEYRACYGYDNTSETLACQSTQLNLNVDFYGLLLLHGIKYSVTVYAVNRVNFTSVSSRSNGVLIDITPPIAGEVYDGIDFVDIDYQKSPTVFSVSWTEFIDEESNVDYYTWKVIINRTTSELDYINERNVGQSMHAIASGHVLQPGTRVVSHIKAINRAGLTTEVSSDGVMVDNTRPLGGFVFDGLPDMENDKDYLSTQSLISAYWTDFVDLESGIAGYNYTVFEHSFVEATNSWSLGTSVATTVNLTEHSNFTTAVNGGMKPGYRYTVAVTAHNGAGLSVTVTSDGIRYVPNELCFDVGSDRASRDRHHLSGTIELRKPAHILCPLNYSSNYSSSNSSNILTPSTHFTFSVLRETNTTINETGANGTDTVKIMKATDIGTYVSPLSPCCRDIGALPISYASSHLSYGLLSLGIRSASKLISFRRLALADAVSVTFMKITDPSTRQMFLPNTTSNETPQIFGDGDEVTLVVYDDRVLVFGVSPDGITLHGYVSLPSVCHSVDKEPSGRFCSAVSLFNDWTTIVVNVHCNGHDFVLYGLISSSGKGSELIWKLQQNVFSAPNTCGSDVSSDDIGNILVRDRDILLLFSCSRSEPCTRIGDDNHVPGLLSAKLLPKTNVIAVSAERKVSFYSFEFKPLCEAFQREKSLANFMELDQTLPFNYTQVVTIGKDRLYVTLFQPRFESDGLCQQIGGVELSSKYLPHTISIKDEMVAFGTDDNLMLRVHLAAFCNINKERSRKTLDSFIFECYPCVGKASSGGAHDDCTHCNNSQCLEKDQTTIDLISPSLNLKGGVNYVIEVDAETEGEKTATVSSERITVDFTPPVVGMVHNGRNQSDILYAGSQEYVLVVSWSSFYDPETDILKYLWCVGTSPGNCDTSPFEEVSANTTQVVCRKCIGKFADRETYFSTVIAVNWALLNSSNSSLGLLIDLSPPKIKFVQEGDAGSVDLDFQMATTYLKANWAAEDVESDIYEYNAVIVPGNFYAAAGNQTEWMFNNITLELKERYYVELVVTNGAQLSAKMRSDGIEISDKNRAVIEGGLPVSLYTNDFEMDVSIPPFPPSNSTEEKENGLDRTTGILEIPAKAFPDQTIVEVYELIFDGSTVPEGVIDPYRQKPPEEGVRVLT